MTVIATGTKFDEFKLKFQKSYKTLSEEKTRETQFYKNLDFIESHNALFKKGIKTYQTGINQFADLSNDEFIKLHLIDRSAPDFPLEYGCDEQFQSQGNNAASVDWTTTANPAGVLADVGVKNQGSCGSCWAFAAVAAFEGAQCIAGNYDCQTWDGASEQNLVDCVNADNTDVDLGRYYCSGCTGGWQSNAFRYIALNGGVDDVFYYHYTSGTSGKEHSCGYSYACSAGTISKCGKTREGDEDDLANAIAEIGPIAIAIDASEQGFQFYSGGVYSSDNCSSDALNHAVTAVGYGNFGGQDYFSIKNSWGKHWGEDGYVAIARNQNNMCGVASDCTYPIL